MPHFPLLSPKQTIAFSELIKTSDCRVKGKLVPSVDGQTSLSSILTTSLYKKDFPIDTSAVVKNGKMGITFNHLDDISRRVAKILKAKICKISHSFNAASKTRGFNNPEAPTNEDGDTVIVILTDSNQIDERILVYLLAILKLGATYVSVQKKNFSSENDWKIFVGKIQPLIIIEVCNENHDSILDPNNIFDSSAENITASTMSCNVSILEGKRSVMLPYHFLESKNLWEEAVRAKKDVEDIVPLKSKTPLGQRAVLICQHHNKVGATKINHHQWIRTCQRIIWNRMQFEKLEFPVQEHEKLFVTYPLSDPRSLIQIFIPLCIGKPVHLLDPDIFNYIRSPTSSTTEKHDGENADYLRKSAEKLLNQIAHHKLNRLCLTPQHLEDLVNFVESTGRRKDLSCTKFWMVSGGPFSLELGRNFFNTFRNEEKCLLTVFYGNHETLWAASYNTASSFKEIEKRTIDGKLCIGSPLYNMSISVIDDKDWTECSLGEKGEICIEFPDPTLETNIFIQTGDMGRIIKDRTVKLPIIEGKVTSRIRLEGKVIDLAQLANKLDIECNQFIKRSVTFLAPRGRDMQLLIVAYTPKHISTPMDRVTIEGAIRNLEPIIHACIEVTTIPRLSNDQIDYRNLRKQYHDHITSCENINWTALFEKEKEPKISIEVAKILFKSIAASIGQRVALIAENIEESFWDLMHSFGKIGSEPGVDHATKAVRTILAVSNQGINYLTPEDIILSNSLRTLVKRIILAKRQNPIWKIEFTDIKKIVRYEPLKMKHWNYVIRCLKEDYDYKATMFSPSSLERYWKRALDDIMKQGLSFVALVDNNIVGCALNCIDFPKPEYVPSGIQRIIGLVQTALDASRELLMHLSEEKGALKTFYFALDSLSMPNQGFNVLIIKDLLEKSYELGKKSGYDSYLVCTANPLIQEVAACMLNYDTLLELSLNGYKTNSLEKPFWNKDDHEKIGVYIKSCGNKC